MNVLVTGRLQEAAASASPRGRVPTVRAERMNRADRDGAKVMGASELGLGQCVVTVHPHVVHVIDHVKGLVEVPDGHARQALQSAGDATVLLL